MIRIFINFTSKTYDYSKTDYGSMVVKVDSLKIRLFGKPKNSWQTHLLAMFSRQGPHTANKSLFFCVNPNARFENKCHVFLHQKLIANSNYVFYFK